MASLLHQDSSTTRGSVVGDDMSVDHLVNEFLVYATARVSGLSAEDAKRSVLDQFPEQRQWLQHGGTAVGAEEEKTEPGSDSSGHDDDEPGDLVEDSEEEEDPFQDDNKLGNDHIGIPYEQWTTPRDQCVWNTPDVRMCRLVRPEDGHFMDHNVGERLSVEQVLSDLQVSSLEQIRVEKPFFTGTDRVMLAVALPPELLLEAPRQTEPFPAGDHKVDDMLAEIQTRAKLLQVAATEAMPLQRAQSLDAKKRPQGHLTPNEPVSMLMQDDIRGPVIFCERRFLPPGLVDPGRFPPDPWFMPMCRWLRSDGSYVELRTAEQLRQRQPPVLEPAEIRKCLGLGPGERYERMLLSAHTPKRDILLVPDAVSKGHFRNVTATRLMEHHDRFEGSIFGPVIVCDSSLWL